MGISTARLHPDLRGELQQFIQSVDRDLDAPSLSEYKSMRLGGSMDARERVALADDGSVIGYGQAAWHRGASAESGHWAIEIVVAPELRHLDIAKELMEALRLEAGGGETTLWTRSQHVVDAAETAGWYRQRELWEMRRALPIADLDPAFSGFEVSTFRMGVDENDWLKANSAAFAGHPENGYMTRRDLENRMAQSWFDQSGFFLAREDGRLAGSCWTKIHDDGVGEIYIIGVVPSWEGRGLGRDLVAHGLHYLGNVRHARTAMLYVEATNERAVRLYRELGFEKIRTVAAYRYPPNS